LGNLKGVGKQVIVRKPYVDTEGTISLDESDKNE